MTGRASGAGLAEIMGADVTGGLRAALATPRGGQWRRFFDPLWVRLADLRARRSGEEREFVRVRFVPGTLGVPDREG